MYHPLWDVMVAGPARCPVWCRLVTVPTDPVTTVTRPTGLFQSEWVKCRPRNTQNGGTILPITNLTVDSESGSPSSYSHYIVTTGLSRLVLEIFACDSWTVRLADKQARTITIASPHIVEGQLKTFNLPVFHKIFNAGLDKPCSNCSLS